MGGRASDAAYRREVARFERAQQKRIRNFYAQNLRKKGSKQSKAAARKKVKRK